MGIQSRSKSLKKPLSNSCTLSTAKKQFKQSSLEFNACDVADIMWHGFMLLFRAFKLLIDVSAGYFDLWTTQLNFSGVTN